MTMDMNSAPPDASRQRGKFGPVLAALVFLGIGGAIGAGVVQAQSGGPWGGGPGGGHGWRDGPRWGWGGRGQDQDGSPGRMRAERFARFCNFDTVRFHPVVRAYAKADLRMSDAQAKDFDGLAGLVLPALEDVKREACNNFAAMGGKAPEKLAQIASVLRKAADAAEKAVEPTRQFYTSLNPEQQARVDELTERRRMRRWQ